jgi:hypothetical protein
VIVAVVAVPAGYFLVKGLRSAGNSNLGPNTNQDVIAEPADQGTERELSYFLRVQKMRDGKPFEAPFKSSGRDIYESGYGFTLVFQPDADGYMYIFNEGSDKQGETGYYLLFPSPTVNNGSAEVSGGRGNTTAGNKFTGGRGTEVMWMIWTKEKREDLEAIVKSVVVPPGIVKDEDMDSLRSFLEKYKTEKTESSKDSDDQRTIVKARGDVVVHRFGLEHR